jgi:hypothetical protein
MEPRPGDVWGVPGKPETYRRVLETWPDRVWYLSHDSTSTVVHMAEWTSWAEFKKRIE